MSVSSPPTGEVEASATTTAVTSVAYQTIARDDVPLSLTAEDGNGLQIAKLDAKVVIEGPLAFTELHLTFTNPDARVREGRFQITLPPGAAVNRFAMKNASGEWMEAEMVERATARRAYEDFLHRRTDPALLEKQAGNQFAARVFPIPASADKELIVSYAQELGEGPYVLPLEGLPVIGEISASARVMKADRTITWDETTLAEKAWAPDRDFAVAANGRPAAVASGELVAMRVVPELGVGAAPVKSATILIDDSASRALGWEHTVEDVGAMIASLAKDGDPRITVAAFDQDVAPIYEGSASGWGAAQAKQLETRGALGASDLGAALAWAHGKNERLVIVTDGVATAGATEAADLTRAATVTGAKRIDVVLAGGIRDDATAHALTGALPDSGAVLDLGAGPQEVARRLGLGTRSSATVAVDGADWVWPTHLDGLQPGDGATIYAALGSSARSRANVKITIGDHAMTVVPANVPRVLVERAAAEAQVLRMEAQAQATTDKAARAELAKKIVALSIQERVISDETALLVLETDADYARYGLDRRALAEILVVGRDGLELQHRKAPAVIAQPAQPVTTAKHKPKESGGDADGKEDEKDANKAPELQKATADKVDLLSEDDNGVADGDDTAAEKKPIATPDITMRPPPEPPPPPATDAPARNLHVDTAPSGAVTGRVANPGPAYHRGGGGQGQADGGEAAVDALLSNGEGAGSGSAYVQADDHYAEDDDDDKDTLPPWTGDYAAIQKAIGAKKLDDALARARAWHGKDPGDLLGLVALGDALEAKGDRAGAARAYGSIIDLFPSRADLRRFAGERLERIADRDPTVSRALVLDTYKRAVEDRPDHLTGHRLYAYALLRAGRYADALAAIEHGLDQPYPSDRFRGGDRILHEDLALIGAAWAQAEPAQKKSIVERLAKRGASLATGPTTRFILYWETDDNDVDFHIRDAHGGHAFYKRMHLRSGGDLYADVTTGYGPEEFAIDGPASSGPYELAIHYFSRGPMGYGMGTLEILHRDTKGNLSFEHRPFIVMNDKAYVDLGTVAR